MAQNPLAVLAAMLGGGFTGYAGDQRQKHEQEQDRQRMALDNSRFEAEVDQFGRTLAQREQQFGEEMGQRKYEFGRTDDLNNRRFGLDEKRFGHDQEFDWQTHWDRMKDADQNRAADYYRTNMMYGRGNPENAVRDAQGAAYMQGLAGDPSQPPGQMRTPDAQKKLNAIGQIMGALGVDAPTAAMGWARSEQYPAGYFQRPDLLGSLFENGGVAPWVPKGQLNKNAPAIPPISPDSNPYRR